jgi:hypothetical protein
MLWNCALRKPGQPKIWTLRCGQKPSEHQPIMKFWAGCRMRQLQIWVISSSIESARQQRIWMALLMEEQDIRWRLSWQTGRLRDFTSISALEILSWSPSRYSTPATGSDLRKFHRLLSQHFTRTAICRKDPRLHASTDAESEQPGSRSRGHGIVGRLQTTASGKSKRGCSGHIRSPSDTPRPAIFAGPSRGMGKAFHCDGS